MIKKWGFVVLTLTTVLLIQISVGYGLPFSLALAFVAMTASAYNGGLFPGLIAGSIVAIDGIYASPEFIRGLAIAFSAYAVVIPVGLQQSKIQKYDNSEGVLLRLRDLDARLKSLVGQWPLLEDTDRLGHIETIQHNFTNVLAIVQGWHELAQERKKERAAIKGQDDDSNRGC